MGAAVARAVAPDQGAPKDNLSPSSHPVFLDCDVEEPNAALLLKPIITQQDEVGILIPEVDFDVEPLAVLTPPPRPTPTATRLLPTATVVPTPTASVVTYRYLPAGPARPDTSRPCPGCPLAHVYSTGQARDAGGNPLAGVRLVCYNDWHRYPVAASKGDGWYDFPIIQATAIWYVVVLDEADQPLSPVEAVDFDLSIACWYRLDWQRTP